MSDAPDGCVTAAPRRLSNAACSHPAGLSLLLATGCRWIEQLSPACCLTVGQSQQQALGHAGRLLGHLLHAQDRHRHVQAVLLAAALAAGDEEALKGVIEHIGTWQPSNAGAAGGSAAGGAAGGAALQLEHLSGSSSAAAPAALIICS